MCSGLGHHSGVLATMAARAARCHPGMIHARPQEADRAEMAIFARSRSRDMNSGLGHHPGVLPSMAARTTRCRCMNKGCPQKGGGADMAGIASER